MEEPSSWSSCVGRMPTCRTRRVPHFRNNGDGVCVVVLVLVVVGDDLQSIFVA